MSVRSFHSVFMASAVAGAALGCYLVSLRVASERAALEEVETEIVLAQRDIRLLQTEIGTRGRLAQLERWNARVLALSAPTADQILGDKFQLARLVRPQPRLPVDAPVILATAPAPEPQQPLAATPDAATAATPGGLLHEAGLKVAEAVPAVTTSARASPARPAAVEVAESKPPAAQKKAGDKGVGPASPAMTRLVRTARVDPLAPLAAEASTAEGSRTDR